MKFFFLVLLLFVLLAPKYPEVTNNTSTSELKRKVASFSSFICNEHLCNKTGLFFCFCLFWFDLFWVFFIGGGGWGLICLFLCRIFGVFLSSYNRHMHVNTKLLKFKEDAEVPRRYPEN